jgi:hypothetical protein
MSLADDLLDEIFFTPDSLPVSDGPFAPSQKLSTLCELPMQASSRTFQFNLPYFVSQLGTQQLGNGWLSFCGLLRRFGIPLFSSLAPLHAVPAAAVPARWSRHHINCALNATELNSADAFEIACCAPDARTWEWSSELQPDRFGSFVSAVRLVAGGDTPIGIGLPLGCHLDDMQLALEAQVDFIHLHARGKRLEANELHSLVKLRSLSNRYQTVRLPILVSAPLSELTHAHKLLALGATAVCIDTLLQPLIPTLAASLTTEAAGGGMLSGLIPAVSPKSLPLPAIEAALAEYQQELISVLRSTGAGQLQRLTSDMLGSCTERAARVTGAALLE